ncbi:MAG: hypothetical protein RLZZ405_803 [Verrucomicrobiota bacterium]
MLRLVRRPAYPGEFNHELIWPLGFLGTLVAGWAWFRTGWRLPDCLFMKWTGFPCLGCGGTRCARNLASFDLAQAFLFHPLLWTLVLLAATWSLWSAVWWVRRDPWRLRLAADEAGRTALRRGVLGLLFLNWLWQCHYLRA